VTVREFSRLLNVSYYSHSLHNIIDWLRDRDVLSHSSKIIRITERGRRVYDEIIRPILEVAENPDSILRYRAKLSNEDKWKLLRIYGKEESTYEGKVKVLLETLRNDGGLTLEEIVSKTGINRGVVIYLLYRLEGLGFVKIIGHKWYTVDRKRV